jgi:hypothetical protein
LNLLCKIAQNNDVILSLDCVCENACATSDAYLLKDILIDCKKKDIENNNAYKVINTGTISKYNSRWGQKEMKYLGDNYLFPIVNKKKFLKLFPNSYGQKANKSKIIIKGLTLLDGTLDLEGEYVPGKSTIIISSNKKNLLSLLAAIINSKFAQFYITERYSSSSYNGGVSFTKDMIKNFPIPNLSTPSLSSWIKKIKDLIDKIMASKSTNPTLNTQNLERQIDNLVYRLYNLTYDEVKIIEPGFPFGKAEYEEIGVEKNV